MPAQLGVSGVARACMLLVEKALQTVFRAPDAREDVLVQHQYLWMLLEYPRVSLRCGVLGCAL